MLHSMNIIVIFVVVAIVCGLLPQSGRSSDGTPLFESVIMAALRSRCGHYIFALWFLSSIFYLFFIPRLISAVTDWLSTILLRMVWP